MTKREKVLASLVGGAVAVLLNLFLIKFFVSNHGALKKNYAIREGELKKLQTAIAERGLWEQKSQWIEAHQPKLDDPARAPVKLMEEVQEMANRNSVLITPGSVRIGTASPKEYYTSVPVSVEMKSSWDDLIKFLAEVQNPEKFIVLEQATLRVDTADKTKMHGELTIAKWYAPR